MSAEYIYDATVVETVLVVEDDPFVRKEIVDQIDASSSFRVSAQASSVVAARAAIEAGVAGIGVFDLRLTDGNATSLIPLAVSRKMAVLVLTVWDDDESVYHALVAGAGGYLLKGDASVGRVVSALSTLQDGGAPISPTIARRLIEDMRGRRVPPSHVTASASTTSSSALSASSGTSALSLLTDRERDVIELFAKGATYDEVANMLTMSVNTVRHHVRSIYRKLHVCSKAEAVTVAFRPD